MPVKVKICGLRKVENARIALETGADYLGFIFYNKSPRYIDPRRAKALMDELRGSDWPDLQAVGVFVNSPVKTVKKLAEELSLFAVQLHGDESPEYTAQLGDDIRVIKAFRVKDASSLAHITDFDTWAILCDAYHPGEYGGTGQQFNYKLLKDLTQEKRLFLAGGLTPNNVGEADRLVRPFALDVSSGVESVPGIKDPDKIRRFIAAAKGLPKVE